MNVTKGLMLTCGAVGTALTVAALSGLTTDMGGPGADDGSSPQIVTLVPIALDLGGAAGQVQVSLRLTVPGESARMIVCQHEKALVAVAERILKREIGGDGGAAKSIPGDIDQPLRSRIAGVVGDRLIENLDVTVTPASATAPVADCSGTPS
ncbi:MAG: hypothetical protein RIA64_11685 [Rhodospirillales bacterium]